MVTLGRKPFPFKGLTKKQAEERLKETARNVRLDKSRQAKRVAPADVNSIDDIVQQARWYGNPQRMDLAGIDTLRPPSTRGRKTKRSEALVSIAAPEPVASEPVLPTQQQKDDAALIALNVLTLRGSARRATLQRFGATSLAALDRRKTQAKAREQAAPPKADPIEKAIRAPSAVSLSLEQRARKMGEDAFARSGGKPVAPAQDKTFMKFLGDKKDDLPTVTPLLKAFTEGFNEQADKVADERVAKLAEDIPAFKDLPSQVEKAKRPVTPQIAPLSEGDIQAAKVKVLGEDVAPSQPTLRALIAEANRLGREGNRMPGYLVCKEHSEPHDY